MWLDGIKNVKLGNDAANYLSVCKWVLGVWGVTEV